MKGDNKKSTSQFIIENNQAFLFLQNREYRVRGLEKNTSFDRLKVNLKLTANNYVHLDTLDLYQARARSTFISTGADITGVDIALLQKDFVKLLSELESFQEKKIQEKISPEKPEIKLTPEEEAKALNLLTDKNLFDRIKEDFTHAGVVGEDTNKLLGYLIAISRKLEKPLCGQIIARSASGKSSLLNAILDFVPEEDKHLVTSLTSQALYYMPEDGLKHMVLAVAEDEGSSNAMYPLKILGSENKLTLAVTVRNPDGGFPETKIKTVNGPAAQLTTSTSSEVEYEYGTRFLILTVDESQEQTKRIHEAQREGETLQGVIHCLERDEIIKTHHNAQRLLKPVRVINPHVNELEFPSDQLRLRRDNPKFLGLIRTIAFLRQYQKKIKKAEHRGETIEYVEVDKTDIKLAKGLADQVLGRSLDELSPPTRSFLLQLDKLVSELAKKKKIDRELIRLSRRQIREHLKWGMTQVREHLNKLIELELVESHKVPGSSGKYEYCLTIGSVSDTYRPLVGSKTDNRNYSKSNT